MKKFVIILVPYLLLVSFFFIGDHGVNIPGNTKVSSNLDKKSEDGLVIMLRTGLEADAIKKIILEYKKETQCNIEYQEIPRDSYFTVMPTHLLAGSNELDVAMIPNTYVGILAGSKALEPLDDYLYKDKVDSGDFFSLYGYNGKIYLIPTDVTTHFLYYRSDLITTPPETWEEYLQLAKKFTRGLNPFSPTEWGASLSGAVPEELPKEFDSILWSYNGDIMDENSGIYINSPESLKAGEFIRRLMDSGVLSPETLSWGHNDVVLNLVNGKTAMAAPFSSSAYYEILNSNGKYKDMIKFALIPGVDGIERNTRRTPLRQSWTFGINANSLHKEAAWKFLLWFMSEEGGRKYVEAAGTPSRLSILLDPQIQAARPEFDLLIKSLYLGKTEPGIFYYPGMLDIESEALSKILTGNVMPKYALEEAAVKIRELSLKSTKKKKY